MLECDIKGCGEIVSEKLTPPEVLKHWVVLRACRCGAHDIKKPKACVCNDSVKDSNPPITYWPALDWWAFGGVEQLILCPLHKHEVYEEICRQRGVDPTMNPDRQDKGNVH